MEFGVFLVGPREGREDVPPELGVEPEGSEWVREEERREERRGLDRQEAELLRRVNRDGGDVIRTLVGH